MKIKCSQESLFYGLQTVQKAITNKSQMPIYNGILFEAIKDKVHLFATDLEIAIDCYIPAEVEEEGSVVMPNKLISALIGKLPKQDISIESSEKTTNVKTKNSKYQIMGFPAEEFSTFPEIEPTISVKVSQGKLKRAIEKTIFAVSKDTYRAFLNGTCFQFNKDNLELVATDSHRLSYIKSNITRIGQLEAKDNEIIIPYKTLTELLKLLEDSDEVFVNLNVEQNQMIFILYPEETERSIRVYSRLIDGKFPDFKKIVPKEFNNNIAVDKENLKKGIERVSLFTDPSDNCLDIEVKAVEGTIKAEDECEMILSSNTADLGKANEKIVCYSKEESVKLTVNSGYILDILSAIETEKVIIKIVDATSPLILLPENNKECLHIAMPIRNQDK